MISCEILLMDNKKLLETLTALKKLGVKTATVDGVTVEFFPKFTRKSKPQSMDYSTLAEPAERMPTDDEMLFYSTDEFDKIRTERKDALNEQN